MKEGLSSFLPHLPGKACSIGGICIIELSLLEFNTDRNILFNIGLWKYLLLCIDNENYNKQ